MSRDKIIAEICSKMYYSMRNEENDSRRYYSSNVLILELKHISVVTFEQSQRVRGHVWVRVGFERIGLDQNVLVKLYESSVKVLGHYVNAQVAFKVRWRLVANFHRYYVFDALQH